MQSEQFKQLFTLVTLVVTVFWAGFCVWITEKAATDKLTVDILAAAGANVLLGALINWTTLCVQFWFRKAKPKEGSKDVAVERS